jgi:hypothetical protein
MRSGRESVARRVSERVAGGGARAGGGDWRRSAVGEGLDRVRRNGGGGGDIGGARVTATATGDGDTVVRSSAGVIAVVVRTGWADLISDLATGGGEEEAHD